MIEFYPMPTNLSHGGVLYPHHQNHGGARFLDNPSPTATNGNAQGLNTNANSSNCGVTQQQQMTGSATAMHAVCALTNANNNNNNNGGGLNNHNNNNSPTSVSASSTASLTAQTISASTAPTTAAALPPTPASVSAPAAALNPNATPALSAACPANVSPSISHLASASAASLLLSASSAAGAVVVSSSSSSKLSADCSGRTEVGQIKCERNYEICEGCGQKIHDRYLMNVGDSSWHEQCLACCYCGMQLHHTCYVRNGKLYCKLDYDRLFGVKCAACCHPILPQEMVMRPIPSYIFHLSCFICFACRLPLQKGEQFMLRDGQLFCFRHDFDKEMYLAAAAAQHCGFVGLDDEDLMRPRDGRRGPKRPRTILTSQQRKQFKASFDQSPKPCRKVREALAKDTGLSVRVVQVWFQNQRAKMKKIQRKAKNGGTSGGGNGGSNGSRNSDDKDKEKDEKCVKQESGSGSENGYLSLDSAFASQPLNPNLPFSPDDYPANSNDSFYSSDLSEGSNFDQQDDDTDSLSLNNGSSGNHHSNPDDIITKLCLMSNSYFNSDQ